MTSNTPQKIDRLIDTKEVCELRSRSRTDLHYAIKAGRFPPGLRLGPRTIRWPLSVVVEAIRKEIAEAQAANAEREAAMLACSQRGVSARRSYRIAAAQAAQQGGAQ